MDDKFRGINFKLDALNALRFFYCQHAAKAREQGLPVEEAEMLYKMKDAELGIRHTEKRLVSRAAKLARKKQPVISKQKLH